MGRWPGVVDYSGPAAYIARVAKRAILLPLIWGRAQTGKRPGANT